MLVKWGAPSAMLQSGARWNAPTWRSAGCFPNSAALSCDYPSAWEEPSGTAKPRAKKLFLKMRKQFFSSLMEVTKNDIS